MRVLPRPCLRGACPVLVAIPAPPPVASAPAAASLAKKLEAVIDGPDYKHASWGILVVERARPARPSTSATRTRCSRPASVTKLFSCAAALIALGAGLTRPKRRSTSAGRWSNGTLRGDLILVAAGDLTFGGRTKDGKTVFKDKDHTYANSGLAESELTDTDPLAGLDDLAKQVKDAGITQIDGEVLIDDRLFARHAAAAAGRTRSRRSWSTTTSSTS